MMVIKKLPVLFVCLLCFTFYACKDEEITEQQYPRLRTLSVTDVSTSGAVFRADVIHPGPTGVTEYGFVWGTDSYLTIETSDKIIVQEPLTGDGFSAVLQHVVDEKVEYYVRAYVRDEDHLVYGNMVIFQR